MDASDEMKVNALASAVLESYDSANILDVVSKARSIEDISEYEKYETVFHSGMFEGARMAFDTTLKAENGMVDVMKAVVRACDHAIQQEDNAEGIIRIGAIREVVTSWFAEQSRIANAHLLAKMCRQYHIEKYLIVGNQPVDEIDRHTLIDIGSKNVATIMPVFAAWAVFDGKPMKCRCPAHLLQALDKSGISVEQARQMTLERFPEPDEAFYEFAKFLILHIRKTLDSVKAGETEAHVQPEEAGRIAHEWIKKLADSAGQSDDAGE